MASGEPEALLSWPELELLREDGVWGEGPLPWFPEKMRLSLLLRVSRGMSLEKRRLPLRGEPKGGVTLGLEQRWGPSKHLDLVVVTSMYFISLLGVGGRKKALVRARSQNRWVERCLAKVVETGGAQAVPPLEGHEFYSWFPRMEIRVGPWRALSLLKTAHPSPIQNCGVQPALGTQGSFP